MRFVEGGYLLYLQRHTYVCTQTQKKGKRKKKGTIIRQEPPLVCPARSPKRRKKAPVKKIPTNRHACSYTTGDAANDTATRRPAAPSIQIRWTVNFRHARTGFTIPDRRGSQAPSPWAPQHQRPPHRLSRLRHPLGRRKSSRRWCRRRRPESRRKKIAVSRLVSQQGRMGTMSVPGCYHRHPHQAWQACRREDLRAGACEGRRSGHRQCRRRQACRSNRPKDR